MVITWNLYGDSRDELRVEAFRRELWQRLRARLSGRPMSARLTALFNELQSLNRKVFLSTRQHRRRETLLRQIEATRAKLEHDATRREERLQRRLDVQS